MRSTWGGAILLVGTACADGPATEVPVDTDAACPPTAEPAPTSFDGPLSDGDLADWEGDWVGSCRAEGFGQFDATLSVAADGEGAFTWDLTYEGQATRAYTMLATNDPRRYVLDENNGILIEYRLVGNQLTGLFTIEGQHIGATWFRSGERLDALLPGYDASPSTSVGPGGVEVDTYLVTSLQRCSLFREE